jgi:RimJ/RimL family protein N-acetyltransferase
VRKFPETIRTRRTTLRRISLADAAGWKRCNNRIAKRQEWPIVPSVVYARNEILHYTVQWETGTRYTYVVLDGTDKVIGDLSIKNLNPRTKRAEYGHAFDPSVWGSGVAHEIMTAMKRTAARAGYRLWGRTDVRNIRSWRSLERYGARYDGTCYVKFDGKRLRMRYYTL